MTLYKDVFDVVMKYVSLLNRVYNIVIYVQKKL